MKTFCLFSGFLLAGILSICAKEKEADLSQHQWKKRIILTYPSSSQAWAVQLKSMRRYHTEIKERDLLIGALDLDKWFKLIDTMPMRRNEMKK